ncbi:MAG: pilin [Candidatus Nealsonbacteria bacterium]|nr:pilin [Candidatus Nealsonbacteria bacterium]
MNYNKINMRKIFLIVFLFLFLFPFLINAQGLVPCGGPDKPACQLCHIFVLFDNIVKFLLIPCLLNSYVAIVPLIATLMIVIGGVMFFAAVGDPSKIGKATSLLTAVAIGLVIIYGAWLLVNAFFLVIGVNVWTGPGEGWFKIDCPIEEGGVPITPPTPPTPPTPTVPSDYTTKDECIGAGYYWYDGACHEEEEDWSGVPQYEINDPNMTCSPISISRECAAGFKLNRGKCEPGDNTELIKSAEIVGEGWYCEFQGKEWVMGTCHPPVGTLYIDCIIDPDYIPPEEQIEQKKKEIEEKYPNLVGEWKEMPIGCPDWDQDCDEAIGTAECGTQKKIKDGFCFPTEPTKLLNPPGEIMGNGWHCELGKADANSPSPEGKSFAYCVPE